MKGKDISERLGVKLKKVLSPDVGLEPTTLRLKA